MSQHLEYIAKFGLDYNKPVYNFSLNRVQLDLINTWIASLRAEIMAIQKEALPSADIRDMIKDDPYYGAIGGGILYKFIPTSLGDILIVRESITGKELNVNDATNWFFYG